ncbi:hypothetical protein DVH24_030670 [Malus domestica]|uniref:Uncharacterized protein n=1 Tax=Malus domestica TaxID=3750 RepID=A0A498HG78_MALDO|nr:hypothetical protein DVH24_030670 [Malus domestica]
MAEENGLGGAVPQEREDTTSGNQVEEKNTGTDGAHRGSDKSGGNEKVEKVAFSKLFSFADKTDIILMLVGTIGAIGNGLCMPLMTILFGDLVNAFGNNQNNSDVVSVVSKVSLKFVYLAIGAGVAATLQVSCWMVTGERQAARIRGLYLETILRQDVAFFDLETNTGEVIGRMSGDTVLIQDAMGEKVGKFLQLLSTFIGGFIIAFIKGWLLTVVMLSSIPLLVAAGATMSIVITKMASHGQTAYAKAANVVEQTIGSIRTVASFTGEKQAITSYKKYLVDAYKSSVYEGTAAGAGFGIVMLVVFSTYALAIWFGSRMVRNNGYSGGAVLNVIVAVLTGSMSLGQASPCLSAFAAGQAAAFKMFETISRKPEIDASDEKGKILDDIRGDIELRDVYFSSHSDLLKDPEGAYSQLVRLQEVNKGSEQIGEAQDKSDITTESFRQSSQRVSLARSVSRNSSLGNSSRHSFSVAFGLPTGLGSNRDTTLAEPEAAALASKPRPKVSLRRLATLNKPEIPVLLLGSLAAIANGVIFPVFGVLISRVIKTFYEPPRQQKKDSEFWAIMFMTLGLISFLVIPVRGYFFSVAGSKLIERIRLMCFERVVHMEVGWFDEPENSSGSVGARLSADAASVRALVGDALAEIVNSIATGIAGLIIAFIASWQLAFIVLALIPLIGFGAYVQTKFMKGFSGDAKMMYEEASQVANDAVGSIRTVASFCAEKKVMELYRRKCEGPRAEGKRQGVISGIGFGVFFALTMAATGISNMSSFGSDSSKARNAAASIFAIIDRKSKIDPSDESGIKLDSVKGDIELRHVSFKYPSRPDIQIFQDLSLTIHSGKTVALVGESGSGKSTVVALMQRFYDPDSGHITLDGTELGKFHLKWLRQQMGLVGQEPVLFNDTIRANIAYGKDGDATEAEIIAASELANAHKFISSLNQGYDTVVGERGIQLSGGQKQRVAIARAIIKSPKILLLDEATSALDSESERVVQDALDRVMVNRTTVVVAHRLSTIKNADEIAVVKNGVIVEKGKHDKLIKITDGFYASLVALHMSAPNA